MSRVKLASIKSLTLYSDALTQARRTSPLSQLVCVGKPCKRYQPEVVHCKNIGGNGVDIDWKCEADLPEAWRFGKVIVSCEGWSGPGDPYVLKDSCSLEYRLVEIPQDLRNDSGHYDTTGKERMDMGTMLFTVLWVALLVFICFSFLKSCLQARPTGPNAASATHGWFPGCPPPYSKSAPQSDNSSWRPGFWTGAVTGALADRYLFRNNPANDAGDRARRQWDWERNRRPTSAFDRRGRSSWFSNTDDRGEGSSNLGNMRQSTGFGGSNVR
ncbi:DUF1183-domain-containing protein [Rhodocollybia butyracea]|uniref:Store-operated calcium entry-associated regulatory factor n=1 Tax=Rhodocollybia butyracea TaxID=206335 RepID=A0A9P5Q2I0_9AGAR|nr:DUF1183-domain-containing protein [Rhodocollybia butyracea]